MSRTEDVLARREVFGMRLGVERMQRLTARLGNPERERTAIHVVGTNGKSSTVRFAAAMLRAHGVRAGAYLSPHVLGFHERVQLDGAPIDEATFAVALARADAAARELDAETGDAITQFELLTAAAFLALAEEGARAWVVEAGLGGRFDATNVVGAPVVALTNIALDHVAQLGTTRAAIAAEKLAVVRDGATLVVGDADDELHALVRRLAPGAARIVELPPGFRLDDAPALAARGGYQAANVALAATAVEAFLGSAFDRGAALAGASAARMPGRLEVVGERPLTILDGAHNPHGAAALAADLEPLLAGRSPRVGVVAIYADKDAAGIVSKLAPAFDRVVATASESPRALGAAAIARLFAERGVAARSVDPPTSAVAAARDEAGVDGAVVVCGSLGLLAELTSLRAAEVG